MIVRFSFILLLFAVCNKSELLSQTCDSLLSVLYSFDEGLTDLSNNNYTGSTQGDALITNFITIPHDAQSALVVPSAAIDGVTDFTISFRIRFKGFNTELTVNGFSPINSMISGFAQNNAFGFGYSQPTNIFNFTFQGVAYEFSPADTLVEEDWYCLAITRSQNGANIYLDGVPINGGFTVPLSPVEVLPGGFVLGQDQDCSAGCYEANQSMHGDLDNFRIYRRALTPEELVVNCQTEFQELTICEGEIVDGYFESGVYEDNFLTADGCDGIRVLNLTVANDTTPISEVPFVDVREVRFICPGASYRGFSDPGNYVDTLDSPFGCDTVLNLSLSISSVYVPNAFSPNSDGVNDRFRIFTNDENVGITNFRIFDRWGGLVYEKETIPAIGTTPADWWWDGRRNGKDLDPGIYLYVFESVCPDGNIRKAGSVTLLR
ncbi:hypothetical protein CEQ90_17935 [Lewinellaceae bacterium SD302]|nr:hypothetical protein CEQ90_17935 [Lewinellaceae bacterium SD302]